MAFALNLRFDLRKLTLEELAERLHLMAEECEEAARQCTGLRLRWSGRGIIRHRAAYPFISFLFASRWYGAAFGPAYGFSLGALLPWGRQDHTLMRWHLSTCEGADILDEIERRRRREARGT